MPSKKKTEKPARKKNRSRAPIQPPRHVSPPVDGMTLALSGLVGSNWLLYLLLAWAVVAAGLFSLPNYNQLLAPGNALANLPTRWLLIAGFAALVVLWRAAPAAEESQWDLKPATSRVLFWIFIGLGAALRLNHPEQPANFFWDDHFIVTSDIRNIIDFNEHPLLFPSGWREPFFPYLTAFLWLFNFHATGVFIVLLSSTLIDLAALWAFYLTGKEIGGRRMGIVLLAMAAICKAMITVCKFGYGCDTTVLACAVALLFFFRLLKKPDLSHFIQWGLSLGFGAYCYVPFRVWTPVLLGIVWLWVFSDPKERQKNIYRWGLGVGLITAWAFLFLYKNYFLTQDNPLVRFLVGWPGLALVAAGLGFCYYQVGRQGIKGEGSKLFGWATGALLTALIMAPVLLHPHYSEHTSDISVFSKKFSPEPGQGWRNFLENIRYSQGLMFGREGDVARMPALGDCFFDFYTAACGLLGLAYFVARPTLNKFWVLVLYVVSLVPFILSNAPHSFRLVALTAPLLLVGAWGLGRLWLGFIQVGSRAGGIVCAVLLLAFCGWEVDRNSRLIHDWLLQEGPDTLIGDQANAELPHFRVYVANLHPGFYTNGLDILSDQKEIFRVNDSNSIDLLPDEKGKDLAILVAGQDLAHQKAIESEFPGLPWHERKMWNQQPQEIPFLKWMEVPFDLIPQGDKGLFHVQRLSAWSWKRRCYSRYGLGRGFILYEDRVTHWNDNLPPYDTIDWNNSMRVEGDWNVVAAGSYAFSIRTGNAMWFEVDGKKIIQNKPSDGNRLQSTTMDLTAGPHRVELVTAFASEHLVPSVMVKGPGASQEISLELLAEANAPK
jgi:hypothetical protein